MRQSETISGTLGKLTELMHEEKVVTLNRCAELFGSHSIVIMLLFFALLNSLPIPSIPGFSTITGIPILLLGLQLMVGTKTMWLPNRIRNRKVNVQKYLPPLEKLTKRLEKWEHYLKPRWLLLSEPPFRNLIGGLIVLAAILLALPIPFFNFPAGASISILSIGLMQKDGVIISLGCLLIGAFFLFAYGLIL